MNPFLPTVQEAKIDDESDVVDEFEDFIAKLDRFELAKSRNNVDLELLLNDQEKLSVNAKGDFRIITVIKDPPEIQFKLIIKNNDKAKPVILNEATKMYSNHLLHVTDKKSICDYNIRCPKESVQIEPLDSYTLQCSVKCKEIGVIVCPFHFRLTKEGIDKGPTIFSIIRQLEVYVCKNIEFCKVVENDVDSEEDDDDDDDDKKTIEVNQKIILPTLDYTYFGNFPSYQRKINIPEMFLELIEDRKNLTEEQRDRIEKTKEKIIKEGDTKSGFVKNLRLTVYHNYYSVNEFYLHRSIIGADFQVLEDTNQIVVSVPSSRPQIRMNWITIFNLMRDDNMICVGFEAKVLIVREYKIVIGGFKDVFYDHLKKVREEGGNVKICLRFCINCSSEIQALKNLNLLEKMPYILDFLFPKIDLKKVPKRLRDNQLKLKFINQQIAGSELQEKVVYDIVEGTSGTNPYLVVGASGVGKTTCLLEAALQVCIHDPRARILLCCHSNSGANELAKLLHFWLQTQNNKTIELNEIKAVRLGSQMLHERVENEGTSVGLPIRYKIERGDLHDYHIVVSTMNKAMALQSSINPYFSHVFLDEISEAEPLSYLVCVGNLKKTGTLVLSGPWDGRYNSKIIDILDTYVKLEDARNSSDKNERDQQKKKAQLTASSPYYTRLKPFQTVQDVFNIPEDNTDPLAGYCLKTGRVMGGSRIFMHGVIWPVRSYGTLTADNQGELQQIIDYLETFLSPSFPFKVEQNDIGIVTYFKMQEQILKEQCAKRNWKHVDIGTIPEIREKGKKRIVISSFCWGHKDLLVSNDYFYEHAGSLLIRQATIGLSKNIFIGHPHLFASSPLIKQLFNRALETGCYTGPPVPLRCYSWFKRTNAILDRVVLTRKCNDQQFNVEGK